MRADDRVRAEFRDRFAQLQRVESFDRSTHAGQRRTRRRAIHDAIQRRPHRRMVLDELDVEVRVQRAERARHVIHYVQMQRFGVECLRRGDAQCLGRAHVSGTGGNAEQQQARLTVHRDMGLPLQREDGVGMLFVLASRERPA